MKTGFCIFFFIISFSSLLAQKEASIWYFSDSTSVIFNNNGVLTVRSDGALSFPQSPPGGCATISDKSGDLLFYTNGEVIYDRNNVPMENGTNLLAHNGIDGNQTSFILHVPESCNLYYVFSIDSRNAPFPDYNPGIWYSVIDISLNNGLGRVIQKNIPLILAPVAQKITAVRHTNGKDIWLITHLWDSDIFNTYLISDSGINPIPVASKIGSVHSGEIYRPGIGAMKASPDGNKLALAITDLYKIEIFNFDKSSGKVYNPILLGSLPNPQNSFPLPLIVEFSPNSSKLYITTLNEISPFKSQLYQLNIDSNNPDQIINSKKIISETDESIFGGMQLGIDGKIYLATNKNYLAVINNPDSIGINCNYIQDAVFLNGKVTSGGLPNFPPFYLQPSYIRFMNTCITDSVEFSININNQSELSFVEWDFGDTSSSENFSASFNPKHKYSESGYFNVSLKAYYTNGTYHIYSTTIYIQEPLTLNLGNDTTMCKGKILILKHCINEINYLWSNNSSDPYYEVTSSDTIWLEISNACGSVRDSIIVNYQEPPEVDLGKDTTLCYDMFPVNLNAVVPGATYKWSDGSINSTFQVPFDDTYWVDVTKGVCTVRDSITFASTSPAPIIHLGKDTALCDNDTLLLNAFNQGANYLWQDHSILPEYYVTKADTVSVKVTLGACIREDSIIVNFKPLPAIYLGNDTTICKGDILTLNAFHPGYSYLWKDGSTQSYFTVSQNDIVWAEVTLNDCKSADSIIVNYISPPSFDLGKDTVLCEGEFLDLQVNVDSASYLWSNGSSLSEQHITESDTIRVKATNKCGEDEDSIIVSFITPPILSLGNDTVLCYHDSLLIKLPNNYEYTWNDSNKGNNYMVTSSGVYTVEAKNKCGTATATKRIENISCCDPFIPNLLTPNKDGLNEVLIISCIEDRGWKLNIFNRWGENIYSTKDYRNDFNASILEEGIYFCSLSKEGRKESKGWIQVVK